MKFYFLNLHILELLVYALNSLNTSSTASSTEPQKRLWRLSTTFAKVKNVVGFLELYTDLSEIHVDIYTPLLDTQTCIVS